MGGQGDVHAPDMDAPLSVLIAANNEEGYIDACLDALLAQDGAAGAVEVIVAANACTDATEARVAARMPDFAARGWVLDCLHIETPGKLHALNRAEAAARGTSRVYLDADVICEPALLGQLRAALSVPAPRYATGTLAVAPARSWSTRHYAALWQQLPFVKGGAVGAGLFALNGAGRARWGAFPAIISDDTFVRLNFAPHERIEVPARYHWPMVEGLSSLIRVRRRQDAGVREIAGRWPELLHNEAKGRLTKGALLRLALRRPVSFSVYMAVHVAVRLRRPREEWTRGR